MNPFGLTSGILALLAVLIGAGTVFFHFAEGWSLLDSYFFTVVTLSTVGYGNLVPATALGKIGTTVLIFLGIGVFALAIQHIGQAAVRRRARQIRRASHRRHAQERRRQLREDE